jgi:hypothetical protein
MPRHEDGGKQVRLLHVRFAKVTTGRAFSDGISLAMKHPPIGIRAS